MDQYLPAVVTGLIAVVGWAATFGTLREATKNNSGRIDKLENTESSQWSAINKNDRELGEIKGILQASGKPNGRAHVNG